MLNKFAQLRHQGVADPNKPMANLGGGGGGGSSQAYYANMDKLYGTQSQAAEFMLNQAMPKIPGYVENSETMVGDAMSGKLAERARATAGADAGQSLGLGLAAADRNMSRYGAEFNPTKMAHATRDAALSGAAMRADSMNKANQWAEDQKWNRNANAFGQVAGMGNGAMANTGAAASGFGAAGNAMMANDSANAAGMGKFGAMVADKAFKDGGEVIEGTSRRVKNEDITLAMGGDAWAAWKDKNPISTSGPQKSGTSPAGALAQGLAAGATAHVAGEGLKAGMKAIGDSELGMMAKALPGRAIDSAKGAMGLNDASLIQGTGPAQASAVPAPLVEAKELAAGSDAVLGTQASVGAEAAAASAAETGAAVAAETGTAASGMAALGPIGLGLAVLSATGALDDLFADGGSVKGRKDMRKGGKVSGPGTETSDSIPARLSKGEFVLNAEAVKLAGKDNLEKINDAGLRKRGGKVPNKGTGERELANGGNLGITLGAAADQTDKLRQIHNQEALVAIQKQNMDRLNKVSDYEMNPEANPLLKDKISASRRTDELEETTQPGRLLKAKDAINRLPGQFALQDVQDFTGLSQARRGALGEVALAAQYAPEELNLAAANGGLKAVVPGAKEGISVSRDGDKLVFTSGGEPVYTGKPSAMQNYARGGKDQGKFVSLSEGAKLIHTDEKGNVKEAASNPKVPDPSKNDAQMDDAVKVMHDFLDANKTMMTQFGGDEQKVRQEAVLLHSQGIGEFKKLNGRAPTRDEAAIIARAAFKKAGTVK